MNIENAVVLVTGAIRGIGLAFCRALLARGARQENAVARDPASVTLPGVHALRLDVLADVITQQTKQGTKAPTPSYLPQPT